MKPSLADLLPGQRGQVVSIDCERQLSRRLMEMGLLPGTRIRVVRTAPLGDPIEIRVRNYSLSLRRAEAAKITVTREAVP